MYMPAVHEEVGVPAVKVTLNVVVAPGPVNGVGTPNPTIALDGLVTWIFGALFATDPDPATTVPLTV